ncbi:hypothetical protein BD414DRAFT_482879 [Trametes punicea]|nr:hypothetical protein BD414DRAFT_482879 [Trametes punicea]
MVYGPHDRQIEEDKEASSYFLDMTNPKGWWWVYIDRLKVQLAVRPVGRTVTESAVVSPSILLPQAVLGARRKWWTTCCTMASCSGRKLTRCMDGGHDSVSVLNDQHDSE